MQLIPINDVGKVGIIRDTPPYQLPPNVWSDGNNIRFLDNGVKKCAGYEEVFATLPFGAYYIFPFLLVHTIYFHSLITVEHIIGLHLESTTLQYGRAVHG